MSPAGTVPSAALRDQQQALVAAVLGPPVPGLLRPADGAGLAVYQHAHGARLASALRDNFEVLALAMGDDGFDALARAYVHAHPSTTASIRWFGHRLAEFIDDSVASAAPDRADLVAHPALADLARMDWALRAAFDAADAPTLEHHHLATLAAADWPALRLALHPSVQLVALQWAVEPAWQALRLAQDSAGPQSGDGPALPAPEASPHWLLVWRQGLDTRWRALEDAQAQLLQRLAQGLGAAPGPDFATLCQLAAERLGADQALPQVVGWLQQWLADGLLRAPGPG